MLSAEDAQLMAVKDELVVVVIATAAVGAVTFITAVVILALRTKGYLDKKFSDAKDLVYRLTAENSRAIRRIEFWAVRKDATFQPGVEPIELVELDKRNGDDPSH